ncbi:hypothetical protein AA0521_1880 [Komagataeibacter intermedius NRIC 0521]|uniref:Membrane transport protein MMPL domain-containing protein n=1 Tax=Komagataeibacter intermedius NRIC 0521 TaxID=1307934 RepID=A0ABQ0PIT6_9PROT|nr:hypothetical protein AA0521_1880 [Komagataeibacter intermedius NRIC 0521]
MFATGTAILVIAALLSMIAVAAMLPTVMAMTTVATMLALPATLVLLRGLGLRCQRKGDAKSEGKQN